MKIGRMNIRKKYNQMSFQKRLLTISIGIWILPVILMQSIFFNTSVAILNEQISDLTTSNLKQIAERFSLKLESYTDVAYQIYADETIVENLSKYHDADARERAVLFFAINERVKQFAQAKQGIRCISLICNTGESITYDGQTGSALDNIWREYADLRDIEPYRLTKGQTGIVLIPTQQIKSENKEDALFFLGKEIYDADKLEEGAIATLVIGIQANVLTEICTESTDREGHSVNFIVDKNGNVVSYCDTKLFGKAITGEEEACEFVKQTGLLEGKKLSGGSYYDSDTGWTFYNVYDQSKIMRPVKIVQRIYWGILLIDALLMVMFIVFTSESFTRYLHKIIDGIRQVENGNLDVVVEVDREDEFGQIGHHFNSMTENMKSLIEEVQEISEKKKEAEIKALEAQINPHFLYNTLDAINWMAIGKGEYDISRMLGNLGVILRYVMSQGNGMALLSEVEEWLRSYIALYQLRYGNSFEFQMHIDAYAKREKIHKLLVQPIIENALLHGIKDIEGGIIRIDVSYMEEADKLYIVIEDNGAGMDEDIVDIFNRRDRDALAGRHIGMGNVLDRIILYYGDAGSWHISSVKGKGTIVELFLPVLRETEEGGV